MDVSTVNSLTTGMSEVQGTASTFTPGRASEERRALIQAVRALNGAELFGQENEFSYVFDRGSQRHVVRIVDRATREVVQQFPTEQVLRLAEELKQRE